MGFPPDEKGIIKKLREGDVLSFDTVYEKYHKRIYYFALGYLKNKEEAEEVLQEVFLSLWRSRGQIKEYYVFSHYLFRITFNAIHKSFRKQASERKHIDTIIKEFVPEDDSTNMDVEYNSLIDAANRIIEKLPTRQKSIFQMSVNENLTNEQIAKKLKISKKTVDNLLSNARAFIKKSLIDGRLISGLFSSLFLGQF